MLSSNQMQKIKLRGDVIAELGVEVGAALREMCVLVGCTILPIENCGVRNGY